MARVSIEDCQKKLANRFALAMTAAHRARQLLGDAKPLVEANNKEAVIALREIAEGYITMQTAEQREAIRAAEQEALEAAAEAEKTETTEASTSNAKASDNDVESDASSKSHTDS